MQSKAACFWHNNCDFIIVHLSVYTHDGQNKISQLNPSLDGSFKSELPPGRYLIVLEKKSGNIGGSNLPVEVTITSNDNTFLSINIDTGIR